MQKTNDEIIKETKIKWEPIDEKVSGLENNVNDWLNQMPKELQEIVIELLSNFEYYSHERVNNILVNLHSEIKRIEGIVFDNTVFSVLHSQRRTYNSSYEYWIEYKNLNNINKNIAIPNIKDLEPEAISMIDNYVFIDDCSGSGKTFIDYLENIVEILDGKRIIYLVVHIMEEALQEIEIFKEKNKVDIVVIYYNKSDKAFNMCELKEKDKTTFISESKILGINKNYILGYKETESLISFYNNTPNNTLGLFWWDSQMYSSIFPRKDEKKPKWQYANNKKKNRQNQNYLSKKREKENE